MRQISSERENCEEEEGNSRPVASKGLAAVQRDIIALTKRHFEQYGTPPPSGPRLYSFSPFSPGSRLTPATHILTNQQVLIKSVHRSLLSVTKFKAQFELEIANLQRIQHSHVIRLLELFHCQSYIALVLDCKPGMTLAQVLRHSGRMEEREGRKVFGAVAQGLAAIHEAGVVHRDLRPEHILIEGETGLIKIAGLGNSKRVRRGQEMMGVVGAPAYMAPETLLQKGFDGYAADIWSLGVLLYSLLSGSEPFQGASLLDLQKSILRGNVTWPEEVTDTGKRLIQGMMAKRPQDRLNMREIVENAWLRGDSEPLHFSQSRPCSPLLSIRPSVLYRVETLGYPRAFTLASLRSHSLTQASVCYHLLNRSTLL